MKNLKNKVSEIKEVAELKNSEKTEIKGGGWLAVVRELYRLATSNGSPQV